MQIVFLGNYSIKHDLTDASLQEALDVINQASLETRLHVTELANALLTHDQAAIVKARDWLLFEKQPRLVGALDAAGQLPFNRRPTLERCLSVPDVLDFSKPIPEPVPVFAKMKSNGGYRIIHRPRHLHRTAQAVIKRAMSPFFVPRPFQYSHRGVPAAIRQVRKAVFSGYDAVAHLDIENHFASFDPELLAKELPLPKEVVEHAVVGQHMKVELDQQKMKGSLSSLSLPQLHKNLLLEAHQGIPPGSSISPLIAMYCTSRLPWPKSSGVVLVNFADNFLVMAQESDVLEKAINTLQKAVAKIPGGHFSLKNEWQGSAYDGFDFLGHRIRATSEAVSIRPSIENIESFMAELAVMDKALGKALHYIGGPTDIDELHLLAKMYAFATGWSAAFAECDHIKDYSLGVMDIIMTELSALKVTLPELKKHIQPGMEYEWLDIDVGERSWRNNAGAPRFHPVRSCGLPRG